MNVDEMNLVIVIGVVVVTVIAVLLALIYFINTKLCSRRNYDPVKSSAVPPTPRNTPAQASSVLSRHHKAYEPGQKTHDVDGLAFIDDKNTPVIVSSTVLTTKV